MNPVAPVPVNAGEFRQVALHLVMESKYNTRKTWSKEEQAELESSLRSSGQLTPGIARELVGGGFELAAGARRRRGLEAIGAKVMDLIVRPMTDAQLIEVIVIENGQREDPHPLEEAEGYALLMKKGLIDGKKYDVQTIAKRVGRSDQYVYDRLQLLKLIPEAKELFFAHRILLGHAIILARLTESWQRKVVLPGKTVNYYQGNRVTGLWTTLDSAGELFAVEAKAKGGDRYDELKTVLPRELQVWVNDHVRFEVAEEQTAPQLFPETVALVAQAEQDREKVIAITYDHQVPHAARDEKVKTYGRAMWARADGNAGSKTCDRSSPALVVAGPDRGESFRACVNRDRCKIHWAANVRKREQREAKKAKTAKKAAAGDTKAQAAVVRDALKERREINRVAREEEIHRLASNDIETAVRGAIEKAPEKECGAKGLVGSWLLEYFAENDVWFGADTTRKLAKASTAAALVRGLVLEILDDRIDDYGGEELGDLGKHFKVDVAAILKKAAAVIDAGPKCVQCGCTEQAACEGGCTWAVKGSRYVCSSKECVDAERKIIPGSPEARAKSPAKGGKPAKKKAKKG